MCLHFSDLYFEATCVTCGLKLCSGKYNCSHRKQGVCSLFWNLAPKQFLKEINEVSKWVTEGRSLEYAYIYILLYIQRNLEKLFLVLLIH